MHIAGDIDQRRSQHWIACVRRNVGQTRIFRNPNSPSATPCGVSPEEIQFMVICGLDFGDTKSFYPLRCVVSNRSCVLRPRRSVFVVMMCWNVPAHHILVAAKPATLCHIQVYDLCRDHGPNDHVKALQIDFSFSAWVSAPIPSSDQP